MKNYEEVAGSMLFQKLFDKCPQAKVLFGFPIDIDAHDKELIQSKRFLMHASYLIQMLGKLLLFNWQLGRMVLAVGKNGVGAGAGAGVGSGRSRMNDRGQQADSDDSANTQCTQYSKFPCLLSLQIPL